MLLLAYNCAFGIIGMLDIKDVLELKARKNHDLMNQNTNQPTCLIQETKT